MPISEDGASLTVAVADPTDAELLAWVARQAGTAVRAAIAVPAAIGRALDLVYPPAGGPDAGSVNPAMIPAAQNAATLVRRFIVSPPLCNCVTASSSPE